MKIDRDTLRQLLHSNILRISFTKANGEHRTGKFTLMQEHLPPVVEATEGKPRKQPNDDVLPVWDMDRKEWRSFRLDSLKGITLGDHEHLADASVTQMAE
jgi:hypothetical protein